MNKNLEKDITHAAFYKVLLNKLVSLSGKIIENKELDETTSKLEIVRKQYSNYMALHDIIRLSFASHPTNNLQLTRPNVKKNALQEMNEALTLIELQSYIQPVHLVDNDQMKEGNLNLFSIEPKVLKERAKKLIKKEHLVILREELQKNVIVQCNEIISFTFPDDVFCTTYEGMGAVTNHMKQLQINSQSHSIMVAKQSRYNSGLLNLIFAELIEYGNAVEGLVTKFRFSEHPHPHLAFALDSLNAYLLKLRRVELEVMTKTYTRQCVKSLMNIDEDLSRTKATVGKSLTQVEHKLSAYQRLDSKFEKLLHEYANIQKDMKIFFNS